MGTTNYYIEHIPDEEKGRNDLTYWNLWSAKNIILCALVLQQTGLLLMIRFSRTTGGADHISLIHRGSIGGNGQIRAQLDTILEITVKQPDGANTDSTKSFNSIALRSPALTRTP